MSKMIKINDCGECPKTCCKYDNQHELILYCSKLEGKTSKIINKFKILPNCPLEDYQETELSTDPCGTCKKPRKNTKNGYPVCPCPHCGCEIPF